MIGALLTGGVTFRRVVRPTHLLLAAGTGLLAGLLVLALPSDELAVSVHQGLVTVLGAVVAVPLVAAVVSSDRLGGYEALSGVRPITSPAWMAGRMLGLFMGGLLLALAVSLSAAVVAGQRPVPEQLPATAQDGSWRFALPSGAVGPFPLTVSAWLPLAASGVLELDVHRGGRVIHLEAPLRPGRRHRVSVPHLDAAGDLYVALTPGPGVLLGQTPPTVTLASTPLGVARLAADRGALGRLAFALLATLAAASAFHFQTACLSGLLAYLRPPPTDLAWVVGLALLLGFAVLGTALIRRQALP